MSIGTFGSPIKKVKGETVSLTTTAAHLAVEPAYHEVKMYCSSAWRMGLAPKLKYAMVYTVAGGFTDYGYAVTDRSSGTHMPLDGMLATSICYMGFTEVPRGVYFDLHATNLNAVAATLDVEYWNGTAWTDVASDSDGTDTTGTTLSKDGLYTWTLPASVEYTVDGKRAHWVRFKPSTTLSATIDVEEIIPAADATTYAYMEAGVEYQFSINRAEVGAFEFDHASTGTLDVTWVMH